MLNFYNSSLLQTERRLVSINSFVEDTDDRKFDVARAALRLQRCVPMAEVHVRNACVATMRASVLKAKGASEPAFAWKDVPAIARKHVLVANKGLLNVEKGRWAFTFIRQVSYFKEKQDRDVSWLFATSMLLACVGATCLMIYGAFKTVSHVIGSSVAEMGTLGWVSVACVFVGYSWCVCMRAQRRA